MFAVDAFEGPRHGVIVAHVERQRMRVQAGGGQFARGGCGGLRVAAVDQHARAAAGQRPRDTEAQPAGRAGHQGHLAREIEVAQIR